MIPQRKGKPTGSKDSTADLEREVEVGRACVQYSRKNRMTGEWENQSIWCSCEELRDLAQVVDQLNEEAAEEDSSAFPKPDDEKEDNHVRACFPSPPVGEEREKPSHENTNEVKQMRRMKLYGIVEYLRSVDFHHDTFDLEEQEVKEILSAYGIDDEMTAAELQQLSQDLYPLAERNEYRQALRLAASQEAVGTMRMVDMEF